MHAQEVIPPGPGGEDNQWFKPGTDALSWNRPPLGIPHFHDGTPGGVESVGKCLNNHALTGIQPETIAVDIATFFDPAIHDRFEVDGLCLPDTVIGLDLTSQGAIGTAAGWIGLFGYLGKGAQAVALG